MGLLFVVGQSKANLHSRLDHRNTTVQPVPNHSAYGDPEGVPRFATNLHEVEGYYSIIYGFSFFFGGHFFLFGPLAPWSTGPLAPRSFGLFGSHCYAFPGQEHQGRSTSHLQL